ncbi:hypothetical protein N1851_034236 [Merluccius polli]|uniref:Uncharacterized protein n=1 Tax=Merluccius polli TaxID=89951 RepID=A0AA47NLL6_MERPO|nr:hypothetical protein N1851_034236 [Merluccius polli]
MQDAAKFGLARMPAVEPAIAALVVSPEEALRPDARCPRPQCRVTDDLLAKAYDAAARMGRIGNSLSHLMLALSASLQEATVDASVHSFGDASLQAFALMSRELGRLMSTLVQARRQVWLAQSPLTETCRRTLRSVPVEPGEVFGSAALEALERTVQARQTRQQLSGLHRNRGEDPVHCAIPKVLEFLQSLLDGGRSPATLRVYVAAISSRHARVDGNTVGCHRLVSLFLKGALRLRPPQAQRAPVWDLPLVLDALCLPPFEPLAQAELKWVSAKTAFLLAITSARRVGELHALSVSESCLRWNSDGSGVVVGITDYLLQVLPGECGHSPSTGCGPAAHLYCFLSLRILVGSREDSAGTDPLMSPEDIDSQVSSGVTGDSVGINTRPAHARDGDIQC